MSAFEAPLPVITLESERQNRSLSESPADMPWTPMKKSSSDGTYYEDSPRLICGNPREWYDIMPDDPINKQGGPDYDINEDDPFFEFWKEQHAADWKHHAFTFANDLAAYQALSAQERHSLERILSGFAQADSLLAENCTVNFASRLPNHTEFKMYLNVKAAMEDIHAVVYKRMIKIYVPDEKRRKEIMNAAVTTPTVKRKIEFMRRGFSDQMTFQEQVVHEVCAEGIFFSTSFADIFRYRAGQKLLVLVESNEYIAGDEALHTRVGGYMMSKGFKRRLPYQRVLEIVQEAVEIECAFVCERIPENFVGYNQEQMCDYARYMGDFCLELMGYEPHWKIALPCKWMEQSALTRKGAMHEWGTMRDYNQSTQAEMVKVVVGDDDW